MAGLRDALSMCPNKGTAAAVEAQFAGNHDEREFAPDFWLPDTRRALALWEQKKAWWQSGSRGCRGLDLISGYPHEVLDQLDLESRWEVGARAAMAGQRIMEPAPVFF